MATEVPPPQTNKRFNEQNLEKIKQCEVRQSEFRSSKLRKGLTDLEKSALQVDSKEAFEVFWAGALSAKGLFDKNREHGRRRAGQQITAATSWAHDIIHNLNPLINIVKDFGAPFGGMAIGTICFFLTVARNRTKMEKQITDTLLHIKDRLPGVKMYQHIYDKDDTELGQQMQAKIVDAYDSFISFSIEASEYYSRRSITRWFSAIMNPGYFSDQVKGVQKAVVEVRMASEDILTRNVSDLKKFNLELLESRDHDRLDKIRTDLGLEIYSAEAHHALLDQHKRNVEWEFGGPFYDLESRPHNMVEQDPAFQAWLCSKTSGMLLLSGRNDVIDAPHCFVSPVALDMAIHLTTPVESNKHPPEFCVFYIFGLSDKDEPYTQILGFFIHRLLCYNTRLLHNQELFNELNAELSVYRRRREATGRENLGYGCEKHLEAILVRVLGTFEADETVWLILDRVDKCQTAVERVLHRRALLKVLSNVVKMTTARLMVLAVINRRDWNTDNFIDELEDEDSDGRTILLTYIQDEM